MAKDQEIQKLWNQELKKHNFKKVGKWNYLPIDDIWTGSVGLGTSSDHGTGSSVDITIGAVWHPHQKLTQELAPDLIMSKGSPTYGEALYELDPYRSQRIGVNWKIQESAHAPIDLSAPLNCLLNQGVPHIYTMCTVEYTLNVLKKRAYYPDARFRSWVNYVVALEITEQHTLAVQTLNEFLIKNEEIEKKFGGDKLIDFSENFFEKFGR